MGVSSKSPNRVNSSQWTTKDNGAHKDPHEDPRRERAAQDQIDHFFRTGEVVDFCDGPCEDLDRYAR